MNLMSEVGSRKPEVLLNCKTNAKTLILIDRKNLTLKVGIRSSFHMKRNIALVLSSGGSRGCAHIGIFNLTNKSIGTMMRKISDLILEKHEPDILINISKESFGTCDFYKAKEIIKVGELTTLNALRSNVLIQLVS